MGSVASAAVNIGVSLSAGGFEASGTETENNEKNRDDAVGAVSYGSIFLEKTLGDRLTLGIDYVPSSLDTETQESTFDDLKAKGDADASADFADASPYPEPSELMDDVYWETDNPDKKTSQGTMFFESLKK